MMSQSKVNSLYTYWQRNNPLFFNGKKIRDDKYTEAVNSFLYFLESRTLSAIEAQKELKRKEHLDLYAEQFISIVVSIAITITLGKLEIALTWDLVVMLVALFTFGPWLYSFFICKNAKQDTLSKHSFVTVVLETYLKLHPVEKQLTYREVQLINNQRILVPTAAEDLWDGKMSTSKYYRFAYLIDVNDSKSLFQYVLHTNHYYELNDNKLDASFKQLCKNQIGKNWIEQKPSVTRLLPPDFILY